MSQKKLTVLDGLNLVDKFLFDETIENKEAFEAIASIVTEESVVLKESPQVEKEKGISPELRAIRLDVIGFTESEKALLMEMQQRNTFNIPKRSRLYQGMVDISLLAPGEKDFNKLNDICMVFIAPFDIFGRGLYRYTFEGVCRECPDLKLNDGALRVFINTKGKNREEFSREFLDFCDYVTESTEEVARRSESERIKLIHKYVSEVRASEKKGVKYMQKWEELAYAREEGRKRSLIAKVCKKHEKGKELEIIADELEEDISVIEPILKVVERMAPNYDIEKICEEVAMLS